MRKKKSDMTEKERQLTKDKVSDINLKIPVSRRNSQKLEIKFRKSQVSFNDESM